jgi:hypothetical protein
MYRVESLTRALQNELALQPKSQVIYDVPEKKAAQCCAGSWFRIGDWMVELSLKTCLKVM